jgi:hypothetical protein
MFFFLCVFLRLKEGGGKRTPYQKWKIRKTLLYYYPLLFIRKTLLDYIINFVTSQELKNEKKCEGDWL